jgi:hypothetical protein
MAKIVTRLAKLEQRTPVGRGLRIFYECDEPPGAFREGDGCCQWQRSQIHMLSEQGWTCFVVLYGESDWRD